MKASHAVGATLVLILGTGATWAQSAPPVANISMKKHPNLAEAQRLSRSAWEKISAAQQANEWDMNGHAAKAKDLLDQVNRELKMSAEMAGKNH